jgi:hypothetical protein
LLPFGAASAEFLINDAVFALNDTLDEALALAQAHGLLIDDSNLPDSLLLYAGADHARDQFLQLSFDEDMRVSRMSAREGYNGRVGITTSLGVAPGDRLQAMMEHIGAPDIWEAYENRGRTDVFTYSLPDGVLVCRTNILPFYPFEMGAYQLPENIYEISIHRADNLSHLNELVSYDHGLVFRDAFFMLEHAWADALYTLDSWDIPYSAQGQDAITIVDEKGGSLVLSFADGMLTKMETTSAEAFTMRFLQVGDPIGRIEALYGVKAAEDDGIVIPFLASELGITIENGCISGLTVRYAE